MQKKYYLAYGSNLSLNHLKSKCPNIVHVGATILNGYTLAFKGSADNYSYLNIEPQEGGVVPVGIFQITEEEEKTLDEYEGFPTLYSKRYISININGEECDALVYVMPKRYDYHIPSREYFVICVQGYMDFQFDLMLLSEAFKRSEANKGRSYIKK